MKVHFVSKWTPESLTRRRLRGLYTTKFSDNANNFDKYFSTRYKKIALRK